MKIKINGLTTNLTVEEAIAWNEGEFAEEVVEVYVPITVGAGSFLRDGEVVMIQGMPDSEWQAWPCDHEMLDGCEAVIVASDGREFRIVER